LPAAVRQIVFAAWRDSRQGDTYDQLHVVIGAFQVDKRALPIPRMAVVDLAHRRPEYDQNVFWAQRGLGWRCFLCATCYSLRLRRPRPIGPQP